MKNTIPTTLLFLLIGTNFCFGQNSWVIQLPENGNPIKMIKTNDGNYVMLFMNYLDSVSRIYKYNNNGEMIWESEQDFFYATHFIELSSGELVMCGKQNSLPFLMILDADGDLIIKNKFEEFEKNSRINNIAETYNNELFAFIGKYSPEKIDTLYRINKQGRIVEKKINITNSPYNYYCKTKNGYIVTGYYPEEYSYTIYDSAMNFAKQQKYSVCPYHIKELKDGFIVHDYYNPSSNDKGLVKLSINLDSVWSVPFSHYYTFDYEISVPDDMVVCSDGGFAMVGSYSTIIMDRIVTYMIITDSLGNPEFFRDYWDYSPQFTVNVVESNDGGFVLFQYIAEEGGGRSNFLVHTNTDGTININDKKHTGSESMMVFPNPANDFINLGFETDPSTVSLVNISDINGRIVKSVQKDPNDLEKIDVSGLKSGLYIIQVIDSEKQYTSKFMKK
jgi:hypothetical protein